MDAKPFARELACLREPAQREAKLLERLQELPPEAAVELLHDLVRLAGEADPDARIAMSSCVGLSRFERELGYDRFAELYIAAADREYSEVKRLLSSTEVKRRPPRAGVENELVERTLGERTQMARTTRDRDLLDRLMKDRNPKVIRNLLLNSRIVENDVVRIAAARPSTPDVLHEILHSPRWSPRERVRKALALNPYLPVGDAVSLLPLLPGPDLDEAVAALDVAEAVRDAAREILARRRSPGKNATSNN